MLQLTPWSWAAGPAAGSDWGQQPLLAFGDLATSSTARSALSGLLNLVRSGIRLRGDGAVSGVGGRTGADKELGPRSKDRYGRLLYYVYTQAGDSIDERLVSEGLAKAWTRDGQHRALLVGLEREAQRDGSGC